MFASVATKLAICSAEASTSFRAVNHSFRRILSGAPKLGFFMGVLIAAHLLRLPYLSKQICNLPLKRQKE